MVSLVGGHITSRAVREKLGEPSFVKSVFVFDTIDSTNDFAKALAAGKAKEALARSVGFDGDVAALDNGTAGDSLITTEEQTEGRGRFGHRWISEKGKNLLFSLLMRPQSEPARLGTLPLCIAASVAETISREAHIEAETKWPNDLLIAGRKICGILVESVWNRDRLDALIIGIGLNVNQIGFPPDIAATSLAEVAGRSFDRVDLLGALIRQMEWLPTITQPARAERIAEIIDGHLTRWRQRAQMLGKDVSVDDGRRTIRGIASDISNNGELLIDVDGVHEKFLAGEVTVVRR